MARSAVSAAKRKKVLELAAKGESQRTIAAKLEIGLATVNRVLNERPTTEAVLPAEQLAAYAKMAPADRLEAQLAALEQVLAQRTLLPGVRSRVLTTYTNVIDRAARIRSKSGAGERQFDGLADLLLSAQHADSTRWSTDPGDWLEDAVPRVLPTLHEIAGALERVPVERRKATADRVRPVLHRILAVLDAP